ncbi:uncharacterized protein LOC135943717 [Cloeon dipterum]|uniref:uncharacterized protein LOC135943717 n=1 Tax=Cloeon dipterum TaxID=197152 RepID=UPI00321F69AB
MYETRETKNKIFGCIVVSRALCASSTMIYLLILVFSMLKPIQAATTTNPTKSQVPQNCTTGDCRLHDSRLRSFLSAALSEDFVPVLAANSITAFWSTNVDLGDVFFRCGRLFYTSHNQRRFGEAALVCAKRKMQLVAVEDGTKNMNCLVPNLKEMSKEEQQNQKYFFVWTSGMAEGSICGNAAYSWCAGNRTSIDAKAFDLPLEVSKNERCLALSVMTKTLVRMSCTTPNYFFCEYKCKTVACMSNQICETSKNDSLFESGTGKIKRQSVSGVWAEWQKTIGYNKYSYTSYLFGYKKVNWTENLKICCSLGMKPIKVTDELLSALNTVGNASNKITIFYTPEYESETNTTEERFVIKTSFWTAVTRLGCAGQYRYCLYDDIGPWDSQDKFWDKVNPRDDGSCLAVDREYTKTGTPFGVRQMKCSSPSTNFACQREGQRVDEFVNGDQEKSTRVQRSCNSPICSDLNYCQLNQFSTASKENKERILFKPRSLGDWKSACGVRFLIHNQMKDWFGALEFCCSLGMRLLSVQSYEKLNCLDSVLEIDMMGYWTSGTNVNCSDQRYRWCSPEFRDYIKPSLNLDNKTINFQPLMMVSMLPPQMTSKLCVVIQKSPTLGPVLGVDMCAMSFRKPICEGRVKAQSHLQEVFNECRATHRVTQRDIEKFNNTDVARSSFKMKCFSSCIAELLGLVYDNGAFWEDEVEKAIKKVKDPRALEDFRSVMKKYPVSLFKKASDDLNALRMTLLEKNKEEAWKSTLFINMAIDKFSECKTIARSNKTQDDCSFVHNVIKCFTNDSSLEKFWNRDLNNLFSSRDYAMTLSKSFNEISLLDSLSKMSSPDLKLDYTKDYRKLQQYIEYVDQESFSEEFTSSRCSFKALRPKNISKEACLVKDKYFEPISGYEDILQSKALNQTQCCGSPTAAAALCYRANGSLITSADFSNAGILTSIAKAQFQRLALILSAAKDLMKMEQINPSMLLDEIYEDPQGLNRWCSTSAEVPKEMLNTFGFSQNLIFYYDEASKKYSSLPVNYKNNLVPSFFCKFDKSFLALCKTIIAK